ncbi:Hypothetical predicted protein [Olea europaea subsp. europaea]|uniref:Uncharacterized protein n=1 Tax=Olea europaea subsp. europaea TaxID=158383 RepID=A0A8S0U2V5_OLEEU|nr:Hypothetical predicted protein [Olea europaea subsp. europaea]
MTEEEFILATLVAGKQMRNCGRQLTNSGNRWGGWRLWFSVCWSSNQTLCLSMFRPRVRKIPMVDLVVGVLIGLQETDNLKISGMWILRTNLLNTQKIHN